MERLAEKYSREPILKKATRILIWDQRLRICTETWHLCSLPLIIPGGGIIVWGVDIGLHKSAGVFLLGEGVINSPGVTFEM